MTEEATEHTQEPSALIAAVPGVSESRWFSPWSESLRLAWAIAKGRRRAELERRRASAFDSRGIHSFSAECGRVFAYQDLEPDLALAGFDPRKFISEAERQAQDEWITEQMEGSHG